MSSYLPPLQIVPLFNLSDYDYSDNSGLTLSQADARYAQLYGYNSMRGTNSFYNFVSLYSSVLSFYNTSNTLVASINSNTGTANFSDIQINGVDLSLTYAPIYSPNFTGVPTCPLASNNTQTSQLASCQYVYNAILALVNGAPSTLSLLNQIDTAINNDPTFYADITNLIATKQDIINSSNLLNAIYVGNGDVNNTTLSYLKNVTYDLNTAITTLQTDTTNITYSSGTTSINNNLNLDRNTLYLADTSNTTSYYNSLYYSGQNMYIANGAGSSNASANTVFRFFTVSPSSYYDAVSINYTGLTVNGTMSASSTITANGGLTVPLGQLLTLNGNLYVNSTNITPTNLYQLNNLSQNVQTALTSFTTSINAINTTLTNVSYTSPNNTTNISGYTAIAEATFNNSISVGNTIAVGGNVNIAGNITISGSIVTPYQSISYRAGYIYVNSMSLPVIKSIPNTTVSWTNLNLQSLLGTNPLNVTASIFPLYRVDFVNCGTVLCSIDNTNGTDCLYNTVTFASALNCTSINCYYNGNLI